MHYLNGCTKNACFLFSGRNLARVHSKYRQTVNITTDAGIFSIQSESMPKTPLSIQVSMSRDEFSDASFNDFIEFRQDCMISGDYIFYCENPGVWDFNISSLYSANKSAPAGLVPAVKAALLSNKWRGGLGAAAVEMLSSPSEALHVIAEINKLSEAGAFEDAAACCMRLLGLGEGLTPSGDDFLTGLLAALFFLGGSSKSMLRKSLINRLSGELHATNDISAEFLKYACIGEFNEPILKVFSAAMQNKPLEGLLTEIATIGHSSGIDTLNGILVGLLNSATGN